MGFSFQDMPNQSKKKLSIELEHDYETIIEEGDLGKQSNNGPTAYPPVIKHGLLENGPLINGFPS